MFTVSIKKQNKIRGFQKYLKEAEERIISNL